MEMSDQLIAQEKTLNLWIQQADGRTAQCLNMLENLLFGWLG